MSSSRLDSTPSNDLLRRSYSMPTTPTTSTHHRSDSNYQPAAAAAAAVAPSPSSSLVIAPVRTAKSEDGIATSLSKPSPTEAPPTSTGSSKSSKNTTTAHHKLDRYGFIINMDSRGNIGQMNTGSSQEHDTNDDDDDEEDIDGSPGNGVGGGSSNSNSNSNKAKRAASATATKAGAATANTPKASKKATATAGLSLDNTPTAAELARTERRTVKWQVMHDKWSTISARRQALIKKRLRKGIPDAMRSTVWPLLCHVDERMQQYPGLYRELVERSVGVESSNKNTAAAAAAAAAAASSNSATAASTTDATTTPSSSTSPKKNKKETKNRNAKKAKQALTAVEEVAAEAAARAAAAAAAEALAAKATAQGRSPPIKQIPVTFHHSKSFKNIQETIERDIHRTFPRHSLFYSNGKDDDENVEKEIKSNNMNDDNDSGSAESADFAQGMCGTSEISSMIRELELTPHSVTLTKAKVTKSEKTAPSSPNDNGDNSNWIHSGNANGDRINQLKILEDAGGQSRLRRVLKAYSTYDREIGYCQGMNFIAAMFLTLVTEEKAFWMLVAVMNDKPCRMRGLFGEGMRETHQVLYVSEKLIHQFLPRLAKHLDKETIHVTMFATQWILTQYTSSFRFELVTRVWDCFLFEGWKITYRVMLSLLQHSQSVLLTRSFEDILAYFRELPERPDINGSIVDDAIKIPLRTSHIAKHEKDYLAQQKKQGRDG